MNLRKQKVPMKIIYNREEPLSPCSSGEGGSGSEEGDCPDSPGGGGGGGGSGGGGGESRTAADDEDSSAPASPAPGPVAASPPAAEDDSAPAAVAVNAVAAEEDGPAAAGAAGTAPATPQTPVTPGPDADADAEMPLADALLAGRESASSRSPSRDSHGSSAPARCPSRESLGSERGAPLVPSSAVAAVAAAAAAAAAAGVLPPAVALPAHPPPRALPPGSPVQAVLPSPHSAALAAYLGAAAAAAAAAGQPHAHPHPHHRLLMTSPLPRGNVSPLVTSSSSPPVLAAAAAVAAGAGAVLSPPPPPLRSPMETDGVAVLDFSTKRGAPKTPRHDESSDADSVLNLSKPPTPVLPAAETNSPLDLSVSSRKRSLDETPPPGSHSSLSLSPSPIAPSRKSSRMASDYKPLASPWPTPGLASHFPYFAAAVAAASSLSPKNNAVSTPSAHAQPDPSLWNGKLKMHEAGSKASPFAPTPSDATKALEKMSELSKLGGDDLFRPAVSVAAAAAAAAAAANSVGSSNASRHSAWQSHWLNKGAEQAKDVLKCVWCKQSFPSLAAMTAHMKEAKHCGVNVPNPQIQPPPPPIPQQPPTNTPTTQPNSAPPPSLSGGGSNKPSGADLNLLIKETMPLPRKLVRGQDVWLGKGAEQTRQILKCMWCGQSFRSLAEMTSHMQQTQHYTNIISQEQIISWKNADDGGKNGGGAGGAAAAGGAGGTSSHVSAVLTCKVCDQAFSSLKELSNHMVKNSHYKEHIMRSITESGGRRRQTREKRKKSLPVRKLLELERAQHELKNGEGLIVGNGGKPAGTGRITCEKCGDKIETSLFVDHIRQCVGGGAIGTNQRNLLKSALLSSNILPPDVVVPPGTPIPPSSDRDGRKSVGDDTSPQPPRSHRSPSLATDLSAPNKDSGGGAGATTGEPASSPSVLNAIEKLIEKSFDSRARHGGGASFGGGMGAAPMGSSILKRLGIDESVDYTKPLVDPQTMNILRNYHHHHYSQHSHSRRERSGSESSSISERGSSTRPESLTPDRRTEPGDRLMPTPRTTPEKRIQTPPSAKANTNHDDVEDTIKKEPGLEEDSEDRKPRAADLTTVKKEEPEEPMEEDDDDRASYHSNATAGLRRRPDDVPLTPASGADDDGEDGGRRSTSSAGGAPSPGLSPRQTPLTPGADAAALSASSPCRNSSTGSPASSERSGTPRSDKKSSSLGALSSMFDSLSGGGAGSTPGGGESSSGRAAAGGTSSHPLAALQKLCDKTERHGGSRAAGGGGGGGPGSNHSAAAGASTPGATSASTAPGAILAFSWACNDAVVTADSIMKCAFCDTPFISKGAYRHHLSKMHFVKDGVIPDGVMALKAQQQAGASGVAAGKGGAPAGAQGGVPPGAGTPSGAAGTPGSSTKSPTHPPGFEESPHSKFLKYTELAKQLSSKYV